MFSNFNMLWTNTSLHTIDKQMKTYQNKAPIVKGCLNAMAIQLTIVATILLLINWIR